MRRASHDAEREGRAACYARTVRFDPDAADRAGAVRYLTERAHQALIDGFHPDGPIEPLCAGEIEWGVRAFVRSPDGVRHQTFYIYAGHRGGGLVSALLRRREHPVVTVPDCNI